jgi:hypothetical protein
MLRALVGKRIASVARVLYEYEGRVDASDGALELRLADGGTLLLEGAADGERLRLRSDGWVDPFLPPLSEENLAFVSKHGKWCRVECSADPAWSALVGQPVSSVSVLENQFGSIAGASMSVGAVTFWFLVECDECHVEWERPARFRSVVTFIAS